MHKHMKQLSQRDFEKALVQNGYVFCRCSGSHHIYKKGQYTLSFPLNPNQIMIRRLCREGHIILDDENKLTRCTEYVGGLNTNGGKLNA